MTQHNSGRAHITFTPWTRRAPMLGWHFASADRDPEILRHWDGSAWSLPVHESAPAVEFRRAQLVADEALEPAAVWWRTLTAESLAWFAAEGAPWHGSEDVRHARPSSRRAQPVASHGVDRIVWRQELQHLLGVSLDSLTRYLKMPGKLPSPDVALSSKKIGWRLSTLHAAGVRVPG